MGAEQRAAEVWREHGWILETLALRPGGVLRHVDAHSGCYLTKRLLEHSTKPVGANALDDLLACGWIERVQETCWSGQGIYQLAARGAAALAATGDDRFAGLDVAALVAAVASEWPYDPRRLGWEVAIRANGVLRLYARDGHTVTWRARRLGWAIASLHRVDFEGERVHGPGEYEVVTVTEDAARDGVALYRFTVAPDAYGDEIEREEWLPAMAAFGLETFPSDDPYARWVLPPGSVRESNALDKGISTVVASGRGAPDPAAWADHLADAVRAARALAGATNADEATDAYRQIVTVTARDAQRLRLKVLRETVTRAETAADLAGVQAAGRRLDGFMTRVLATLPAAQRATILGLADARSDHP